MRWRRLIDDVEAGNADFDVLLVFDISRLGPVPGRRRERLL